MADYATAINMVECMIPPDSQGFADVPNDGIVEIQLEGGAPRQRVDQFATVDTVTLRWTLTPEGYNYIRAFWRKVKGTWFLLRMPLDTSDPTELHQCLFQANTFRLVSQQGLQYVVQATVYATPATVDPNDDAQALAAFDNGMTDTPSE